MTRAVVKHIRDALGQLNTVCSNGGNVSVCALIVSYFKFFPGA